MMSDLQEFDGSDFSLDDFACDIDDDVLDAILEENDVGNDRLNLTLNRLNCKFLDTLKECNNKDFSCNSTKDLESTLFNTKQELMRANALENMQSIDQSFEPIVAEPLPMNVGESLTTTN